MASAVRRVRCSKDISKEVDLPGIAAERCISYETAKGKIRDLKKFLKEKTLKYMQEERAS